MSESIIVPNVDLLEATMVHVETHPEGHDQTAWGRRTPCGTALCFADRALELSGRVTAWHWLPLDDDGNASLALVKLDGEADWLCPDEAANHVLGVDGWGRVFTVPDLDLATSLYHPSNTVDDLRAVVEQIKREVAAT
jgi:hypothetical protein